MLKNRCSYLLSLSFIILCSAIILRILFKHVYCRVKDTMRYVTYIVFHYLSVQSASSRSCKTLAYIMFLVGKLVASRHREVYVTGSVCELSEQNGWWE
jgi:hypothetical protein